MNTLCRISCLVTQIAFVLGSTSVHAEDGEDRESSVSITGALELGYSHEYNLDLVDENDDAYTLEPLLELGVEYEYSDDLRFVLNIEYGREREFEDDGEGTETSYESSLSLDKAFVEVSDLFSGGSIADDITLTLGRQSISDSREWFYDSEVDGLVLEAEFPALDLDLMFSVNREEWIGSDLLAHNKPDPQTNIILSLEYQYFKGVDIGAYSIVRNDRSADDDSPRFVGLTARGNLLDKRLNFWADLASVDGQDGDESIKGHGYDLGATFNLSGAGQPYVTLGYAFGSGDGDEDTDFRQTGLQDNNDRLGGVTSFKFYGELVDPELSNLKILTAGIGFRPASDMSVDFMYHRYEQVVALDELRDSDIDLDPNGVDKDIGAELDVVVGFTLFEKIETELVLGYFQPGAAFDDADDAAIVSTQFSYEF